MAQDSDLLIRFRRIDPDGGGPGDDDWEDYPCPAGFTGPVPIPPGGGSGGGSGGGGSGGGSGGGGAASGVNVSLVAFIGNRRAGGGGGGGSATDDRLRREELTIRFGADDEEAKCLNWARLICWKPFPLTYLNLVVTSVQYHGLYTTDEALPTLEGAFDHATGQITLFELENEDGELVKPSIRVMWPNGNLRGFLDLVNVGNPWYEVIYRLRDTLPEGEAVPPLWIAGPYLPGDSEDEQHNITYGWRIPVRFTLAEGLAEPGPNTGAVGLWEYADLTTAETAFKPMNGPGSSIIVAEPPEPGEEPTAPGIDFNEAGLNAWVLDNGQPAQGEYTLLMEVLPAWGRFTLRGRYFCHDQARDLEGEYAFYRLPSIFNQVPVAVVPVAYLMLCPLSWIVVRFYYHPGGFGGGFFDPGIKVMQPDIGQTYCVTGEMLMESHGSEYMDYVRFYNAGYDESEVYYYTYLINARKIWTDFGADELKLDIIGAWAANEEYGETLNVPIRVKAYRVVAEPYYDQEEHNWVLPGATPLGEANITVQLGRNVNLQNGNFLTYAVINRDGVINFTNE